MKKTLSAIFAVIIAVTMIAGFVYIDNNNGSRTGTNGQDTYVPVASEFDATAIYTDNFDGANDTTSLKARGYLVHRRGPGPIGLVAIWFSPGAPPPFNAYNGPTTGYVASNYNSSIGNNAIDNWLVIPKPTGGMLAGDSLYFWSRSPDGSTYPDSMKVMYSTTDSIPEGTWSELGRFKVTTSGAWERRGFRAPTSSADGRFAIRYGCINAGPNGTNTDFSGIDAMVIERNTTGIHNTNNGVPSTYSLDQNYPNPFNPVTNIKFALPKSGTVKLAVYDIIGNEVAVLVNGHMESGNYIADFDASKLSSGVYFYTLTSGDFTQTKKMMLIK